MAFGQLVSGSVSGSVNWSVLVSISQPWLVSSVMCAHLVGHSQSGIWSFSHLPIWSMRAFWSANYRVSCQFLSIV